MVELPKTGWTYREVAETKGINPDRFEALMVNRFDIRTEDGGRKKEGKPYHLSYTLEWAERIKKGIHWAAADSKTEAALKEAGY